jgi:hypothetical protein
VLSEQINNIIGLIPRLTGEEKPHKRSHRH